MARTEQQLWDALKAAEKREKAASDLHTELERGNSDASYQSAFEAMANARIDLQAAQEAYDAVVANN